MMVRALTFRKRFSQIEHNSQWWALIGHSDELECSEMKSMTLKEIREFNDNLFKKNSKDAYHYAIFLIDNETSDKNQQPDAEIWETGDSFISITRIHFPDSINLQAQYNDLKNYLAVLSSDSAYSQISWRAYYTMELSDVVLVSKACSLQILSRWSLLATKTELVGRAYTYFGVPGSLIDRDRTTWPETIWEDYLDYIAIRFSVLGGDVDQALQNVRLYLGQDKTTPAYRVAGNEDAIICGQNIQVANLIMLYQTWYTDSSNILGIFRDIITRLGAGWEETPPSLETSNYERKETRLEHYSKTVLSKVQEKVLHNETLSEKEWLRPLVELTNALVHMSQSATLDEPVFLILPGLNAFWDNVLDKSQTCSAETMYLRFAELCIHTAEHLLRAEGQLSHRPEMRPLTYDMPVFVLEYATSFLLTLSKVLTVADGPSAEKICFLLVPSASMTVSTEEPFVANNNTPGLLQTTVPFSLLYKPKYLLPALCHEMAHYVGEKIRGREVRYWCFLQSTSTEIIRYFFDNVTDENGQLHEYLVHEFLDNSIREWIKKNTLGEEIDIFKEPLCDIGIVIKEVIEELIHNEKPDAYLNLIRKYVLSEYRGAKLYGFSQLMLEDRRKPFMDRLDDLLVSYREAYADICMLYLLNLDPLDYLKVAVRRWDVLNTGMIFQAYLSLKVAGYSLAEIVDAFESWGKSQDVDGDKRDWARNQICEINLLLDSNSVCAEQFLLEYLRQCWVEFEKVKLGIKPAGVKYTVNEMYEKLLNIDNDTNYQEVLNIIDEGRRLVIEQLSASLG